MGILSIPFPYYIFSFQHSLKQMKLLFRKDSLAILVSGKRMLSMKFAVAAFDFPPDSSVRSLGRLLCCL
jgi:hypothetical protein